MAKCIMIQGTMSNAGKSFLVAGICRILKQDGYRVAPFKSQNMALNSYITEDGLEMGRAQVMQAEACGVEPAVYMNPILLKPTTDVGSQVIVNGVPRGNMRASDYFKYKTELIPDILNAWHKLKEDYDVIVIEGAGSPAEINLKEHDIVNMGLAELVDAPVLLVGDIDRGGVFAQLAGTLALLEEEERQRVKGFVMNKFRGDAEILRPGLDMLWERCHVETIGVIPYAYLDLDDEDSLSERLTGERAGKEERTYKDPKTDGEEETSESPETEGEGKIKSGASANQKESVKRLSERQAGVLKIAVIRLPRISNFTDLNVLQAMDGVKVSYVSKVSELGEPHMVILPGTKSTIADMRWLRQSGLEAAILKLHSRGVTIFGICGGFQMLGKKISDPSGVEAEKEEECTVPCISGMGLFPFETVFRGEKVRRRVTGLSGKFSGAYAEASEKRVSGYEIHMGQSETANSRNMPENASGNSPENRTLICQKGNVFGTYVHGVFDEQEFRESFLHAVAGKNGIDLAAQRVTDYRAYKESQYDKLADVVRGGMDMEKFYEILGLYPEKYFPEGDPLKKCGEDRKHPESGNLESGNLENGNTKNENRKDDNSESENPGDGYREKRNPESKNATGKKGGFLHLYYGDGKGKTTAAVGLAVRAAGAGKKVVFCQFLKSGESAELEVLRCTPGIRILRSEEKFGFSWTLSEEEKARLREIHTNIFNEAMRLAETGRCDVLILDEICDALRKDLMDREVFYRCLETAGPGRGGGNRQDPLSDSGGMKKESDGENGENSRGGRRQACEWVLTGREPDERLLAAADYVTHMEKERHPFDDGVKARRGIEY